MGLSTNSRGGPAATTGISSGPRGSGYGAGGRTAADASRRLGAGERVVDKDGRHTRGRVAGSRDGQLLSGIQGLGHRRRRQPDPSLTPCWAVG